MASRSTSESEHEVVKEKAFTIYCDYSRASEPLGCRGWHYKKGRDGRMKMTAHGRAEVGVSNFHDIEDEPEADASSGMDDAETEDDMPISSWSKQAVLFLSSSLRKNTRSSYATAMRAWDRYVCLQGFAINLG